MYEILIFVLLLLTSLWRQKRLWIILSGLKKFWLVYTTIIGISIYNHYHPLPLLIDSLKKAIVGFIIAYFAEHGLVAAPFYLILLLTYYSHNWV